MRGEIRSDVAPRSLRQALGFRGLVVHPFLERRPDGVEFRLLSPALFLLGGLLFARAKLDTEASGGFLEGAGGGVRGVRRELRRHLPEGSERLGPRRLRGPHAPVGPDRDRAEPDERRAREGENEKNDRPRCAHQDPPWPGCA